MGLRIIVKTKFDCTATGVTGHHRHGDAAVWNKARNQQRNFEALTQIIGLYTQPQNLSQPEYDSDKKLWQFTFETEFEGIFRTGVDELGVLKQSCHGTPMIVGLDEADVDEPILIPEHNVWFEIE